MKKTLTLLLLIYLSCSGILKAQDVHFSQFYSASMLLNPALTGFARNDFQVVLNYRNQNNGLIPYSTYAASTDMKVARIKTQPNVFAVGFAAVVDNVDRGKIQSMNMLGSAAYHLCLSKVKSTFINAGLQVGMMQRVSDPNGFSYPSQWNDQLGYIETQDNNEQFAAQQTTNLDMNGGLFFFSKPKPNIAIFAGAAATHINRPKEKFLGFDERMPSRIVFHGGTRFKVSEVISMMPNMIVMVHNKSREISEGTSVIYKLGESKNNLRMGAWYRHSDRGLIFSAGIDIQDFQFTVSSDFVSRVQSLSKTSGAFEFSLIYSSSMRESADLEANPRNKY